MAGPARVWSHRGLAQLSVRGEWERTGDVVHAYGKVFGPDRVSDEPVFDGKWIDQEDGGFQFGSQDEGGVYALTLLVGLRVCSNTNKA